MGRRAVRSLAVALVLVAGCTPNDELARQRVDVAAETCVSILERRHDGDVDREEIERDAGAEAFAAGYETKDGEHRTTASLIRNLCRQKSS